MDPEANDTIELAALGRPFSLGMLYDCRRDLLVPGMTLWDRDALEKGIRERPQPNSEFEIVASESIEDKSSALNVQASLKASFLGRLIEVEGSAKYLNDSKISKNEARVTLKYKNTTKFQELSMNHLGSGNMKHQYVFDKGMATHVVTGILYGAQAFFVFHRELTEKEDHQDIEGSLKVMIKKIPTLAIEVEGSLQMSETDISKVQRFSCKFHGDFNLQKNPVSFQDAIEVYQSLPKLLGANGENAVPVKVWLMPLKSLDSAAAQIVRQISIRLVMEAQSILEDFNELEMRCNDAIKNSTTQQFPQIGKKLKTFKELFSEYKLEFQRTLAKKLPSIRGGGEEEAVLAEVLKKRHSSPFNNKNLSEWMSCKEREINILKSLTDMMKNTKIVTSRYALDQEILSAEHAVCFAFTSLKDDEPYLSALLKYLQETPQTKSLQDITYQTYDVEKAQWYFPQEVMDAVRQKAKLFIDFSETNIDNENIRFLTAGIKNEKPKGASIHLYKEGSFTPENFEPPSKPEKPAVRDTTHNSVTVKISPPGFGAENITHYSVEYCVSGEDDWQQMKVLTAGEVTVSSLTPNTEYLFRCRAVCSVGKGPASDVSGPITTLPTSPPGEPQAEPNSNELSVSWEKPAEIGKGVNIMSYIVEYAKTAPGVKHEELEWNQMVSQNEKAIISGLKPETEYAVRVRCDCGVAGRSKESNTVNVWTKKQVHLAELLRCTSKLINSETPALYKLPLKKEDMDISGCTRYSLGEESLKLNLTIMVFGSIGSEKSTLINGMINYIVGVEWNDSFRFKLIDEGQLRSQVTVYKINHQEGFKIPYSLTIVDTPDFPAIMSIFGFADETIWCGASTELEDLMRRLFASSNLASEIDVLCFVTRATDPKRSTSYTRLYMFELMLSIFGKDVAENIWTMLTFADGQEPPVLEDISASCRTLPKTSKGQPIHFTFNNWAFFSAKKPSAEHSEAHDDDDDDDDSGFDELFWYMNTKNMKKFFADLAIKK
ncbi:stonustoxin subunit alpha-like [Myripristis murdjan]|uniref:stonustoxin subunit alpha-like n=1 Tax=Myripristis murdjan TaxID=586833 RepID=UPI001175CCC3|nr:stonustoxin subunit alpha-like [Myripristis murdjan]